MTVQRLYERRQRTLARAVEVRGVGYLTGKMVTLRMLPAPASAGVVFVRGDLGPQARVAARSGNVTGTQRRTTLGKPPVCVGLVEHVLAALAGCVIDNCLVEVDAPEPPGLDGSALAFVRAIHKAGAVVQETTTTVWTVTAPVLVQHDGATLALHPAAAPPLRLSYLLDYGALSPIHPQRFSCDLDPATFSTRVAPSRTFLLEEEAHALLKQGLGKNTGVGDLLVFGPRGPIGNRLRFGNEPARHKALDILGDLSLLGQPLCGHVVAYRSGHPLNLELVKTLEGMIAQTSQSVAREMAA